MDAFEIPAASTPDAFWSALEDYYRQLMSALSTSPELAALIRGWIAVSATPALKQIQQEMAMAMDTWLLTQSSDVAAQPGQINALIGMIRRALEP